jgi:hypothetical protein
VSAAKKVSTTHPVVAANEPDVTLAPAVAANEPMRARRVRVAFAPGVDEAAGTAILRAFIRSGRKLVTTARVVDTNSVGA